MPSKTPQDLPPLNTLHTRFRPPDEVRTLQEFERQNFGASTSYGPSRSAPAGPSGKHNEVRLSYIAMSFLLINPYFRSEFAPQCQCQEFIRYPRIQLHFLPLSLSLNAHGTVVEDLPVEEPSTSLQQALGRWEHIPLIAPLRYLRMEYDRASLQSLAGLCVPDLHIEGEQAMRGHRSCRLLHPRAT